MARKSCFTEYARGDALLERYHDEEWGLPCRDEQEIGTSIGCLVFICIF